MSRPNATSPYAQQLRIIGWIANATEFMVSAQRGHNAADIDAAIEHAVDLYVNRGATPGSAIPAGVRWARTLILARRANNIILMRSHHA